MAELASPCIRPYGQGMTVGQLRELLRRAFTRWSSDNASRLAAAFSFYAMLSLAPLLVFSIAVASNFLDEGSLRQQIVSSARAELGKGASELLVTMIEQAAKPGANALAKVISLALALWGASGLFTQLDLSVDQIWGVTKKKQGAVTAFLIGKAAAVLMTLAFIIVLLAWLGIDSVFAYLQRTTGGFEGWRWISLGASTVFLTGVFGVAFKGMPQGMVAWKDVWIPAAFTAVGFTILKFLLGLYFTIGNVGAAYGPAGALVLILLWLYYASQLFFFGVELTFAYAYEHGSHKTDHAGELQMS